MARSSKTQASPNKRSGRIGRGRRARIVALMLVLVALLFAVNPARVHYLMLEGREDLQSGSPEAALEVFEKARELAPDRAETYFWLARAHRKLGHLQEVRENLDRAKSLGFDAERLRREWYLVLAGRGYTHRVEPHLSEMLAHPEDGIEACEAFSTGYCLNLEFEKAHLLLDVWQADFPDDPRPYLRRGQILAGEEKWGKAETQFRKALERAPHETKARSGLAETLIHQGRLDEAARELKTILRDDGGNEDALLCIAKLSQERGELELAAKTFRRVLEQNPDQFDARLSLAKVLLKMNQPQEAEQHARQLVEKWPQDLQAVYTLAQALQQSGRGDQAEEYYARFSKMQDALIRLEELKRVVHQKSDDPEIRYELGHLLLRHVSREEGVAWLQSVFYYAPNHEEAHRTLAEYYEKIGDTKLAEQHRRQLSSDEDQLTNLSSVSRNGKFPQ